VEINRMIQDGQLIWQPSAAFAQDCNLMHYMRWLQTQRGLHFADYHALWQWSVTELEAFWASIWDYFEIPSRNPSDPPYRRVLTAQTLATPRADGSTLSAEHARWFEGAQLNYVDRMFFKRDPAKCAIRWKTEQSALQDMSWAQLQQQVASLAHHLRALGVQRGDRVVAYLPNQPITVVCFLAAASIGAIWSVCAPDMGQVAVLDRFTQIEPTVLIAVDGYHYNGKAIDRQDVVSELAAKLPTLKHVLIMPNLHATVDHARFARAQGVHDLRMLLHEAVELQTEALPFDHPLWVVYSSGTTGLPKPIVHGHGGIVLVQLALKTFHNNVKPSDVYMWLTSSGWIMWNAQVAALMTGATVAMMDGSPAWPDMAVLWTFAQDARVTHFGAGAAFYSNCIKAGVQPRKIANLSAIHSVGSTGSPLPAPAYAWLQEQLGAQVWISPMSGGTDFAGSFVGGVPMLPVHAGEMQARLLGAKVEAFDEAGNSVIDQVGELVCTAPMPSMPLYFWNDAHGQRYHDSYFDMYPGTWRHGDWIKITPTGGAIIYGRSDATINRQGIRMGTAELYRVVEELPEVMDSLVVDLEYLGRESYMALFVKLRDGHALTDALAGTIKARIKAGLSARHVPNEIIAVPDVPRTLSGKKMEVPIKKLLLGQPIEKVASADAMANPACLPFYVQFAQATQMTRRTAQSG
jgi:acetoacetyl-CoA synthetase